MTQNCLLCKNESRLLFRTKDFNRQISPDIFHYYRCTSCGLIFLEPIPENISKFYPNDYYSIPASLVELEPTTEYERYKIDIVKQFVSSGRLLEIGPAYGSFLYLAKQAGFDAEAIEMDSRCCNFIRELLGIKVIHGNDPVEGLKNSENYDVITLWHVIEHLPNPWDVLEAISIKLNPGGFLILAAPNPSSFQFRILGRYWPHVDAPRHLQLIPLSLLKKKMLSLGLSPIWSTTTDKGALGWNVFGWMYFFANFAKHPYIKIMLNTVGKYTSILLSPIERRKNFGSAYTIVFKKEKA